MTLLCHLVRTPQFYTIVMKCSQMYVKCCVTGSENLPDQLQQCPGVNLITVYWFLGLAYYYDLLEFCTLLPYLLVLRR